jgi:hypothetical protein
MRMRRINLMTVGEEKLLQIDIAVVQLITSILVTLGSTLFAISIGFELTLPPAVKQVISQMVVMNVPEIPYELMQESLSNYIRLLATSGVVLVVAGISYSSAKIRKIKKKIREN